MQQKTPTDVLEDTLEAINEAINQNAKDIGVNAEDASRSDLDYLIEYAKKQIDKIAYYQDNLAYFLYFFAFKARKWALNTFLQNSCQIAVKRPAGNRQKNKKGSKH